MSRGPGRQQRNIRHILQHCHDQELGNPSFAVMRRIYIEGIGGNPQTDRLNQNVERALKRALKSLVDKGEVVILGGRGGQRDPYRYALVAAIANGAGVEEPETAAAKQIVDEMVRVAARMGVPIPKLIEELRKMEGAQQTP